MNIKILVSISFILLLIFSTIGCIDNSSPDSDVILNENNPSQEFSGESLFTECQWKLDGINVKNEKLPDVGDTATYTLNWTNLSVGEHKLSLCDDLGKVTWIIYVEPYQEYVIEQELIVVQEEQFSWNDIRSEWKEKSDKIMNGEEI